MSDIRLAFGCYLIVCQESFIFCTRLAFAWLRSGSSCLMKLGHLLKLSKCFPAARIWIQILALIKIGSHRSPRRPQGLLSLRGNAGAHLHCMPRPTTSLVEPKLVRIRPWDLEHSLRVYLMSFSPNFGRACQPAVKTEDYARKDRPFFDRWGCCLFCWFNIRHPLLCS